MKTRLRHPLRHAVADLGGRRRAVDDRPQSHQRAEPTEGERFTGKEIVGPVALSVLSMVFASSVAIYMAFHLAPGLLCSTERKLSGANIDHALIVVVLGGLVGSVVALVARKRRRLLATVLFLGAATLGVAIALVGFDSATYARISFCLPFGRETSTDHVGYLYLLWGVPLGVLVLQAFRTLG